MLGRGRRWRCALAAPRTRDQGGAKCATDAKLKAAGYEATGRYLAAGHDQDQWRQVCSEVVRPIYRGD